MSDNLALWQAVEKTAPAHVKPITGKAYQGNSPKPYYLVQKATETFGPCGIGWGFEIVEEKVLDGALLEPGFYQRIHMAHVRVWYRWNGERGTVEHVGQTEFCGKRANGKPFTDEDAPKKSVTDALVKALSMIGFAGDIFMGRYDDSKYVNELKREAAEEATQKQRQPEPQAAREAPKTDRPAAGTREWREALFKHARARAALGNDQLNEWWDRQSDEARRALADINDELDAIVNEALSRREAAE